MQTDRLLENKVFPFKEVLFDFYNNQYKNFYLVGGFVRDLLLGRTIKDIDIVAEGIDYRDFATKINRFIKGNRVEFKDNVRLVKDGVTIDISKLRGKDLLEDLKYRDFTINNLALHFENGLIGDRTDIDKGIIRIAYNNSFIDDPLRILRGFRFMSELNFTIDSFTLDMMINNKNLLDSIPSERINKEFTTLLLGVNCYNTLIEMRKSGVIFKLIPEFSTLDSLYGGKYHTEDVLSHTFTFTKIVLNQLHKYNERDKLVLILASLLHDIGKGAEIYKDTKGKFFDHEKIGAKMSEQILKRLSFPLKIVKDVCFLVEKHGYIRRFVTNGVRDFTLLKFVFENYNFLDKIIEISISDAKSKLRDTVEFYEMIRNIRESMKLLDFEKLKLVSGNDLLSLGVPKGPLMGYMLKEVHFRLVSGFIKDRDEAIKFIKYLLKEKLQQS
ncbi:MAG: HD domain-containing protein [Deferribacterales bacterium]